MRIREVISLVTLIIHCIVGQSQDIFSLIEELQASEPDILDQNALNNIDSYQSRARDAAAAILQNPSADRVRNYYVLACIYYATNGVGNRITDLTIPGSSIPEWLVDDWITEDYCNWFGVNCNEEGNVIAIDLHENQLYGSWPNEVVLLKDHLVMIDLYNNYYLHSIEPIWLTKMSELLFLFFGTTAFEHNGVPTYLNGCKKLIEFDMSYSFWSEGPMRPEAFEGLESLSYLDMGNNIYDTTDTATIPSTIVSLPSLTDFYIDNCIFAPNTLSLEFLTKMNSLIETWNDFTPFTGSIPNNLPTSLHSLSLGHCELTGTIPSSLGQTQIDRLWLNGNELTGTIPVELRSLSGMLWLHLEDNQLSGSVPDSICSLGAEIGVDCEVACDCCTCCGSECFLDSDSVTSTTPPPSPGPTVPGAPSPTSPSTTTLVTMAPTTPLIPTSLAPIAPTRPPVAASTKPPKSPSPTTNIISLVGLVDYSGDVATVSKGMALVIPAIYAAWLVCC